MKLVHEKTGLEVVEGEQVISFRDELYTVTGWAKPHKPSSTGRVYVKPLGGGDSSGREYYPGVFDLKFV